MVSSGYDDGPFRYSVDSYAPIEVLFPLRAIVLQDNPLRPVDFLDLLSCFGSRSVRSAFPFSQDLLPQKCPPPLILPLFFSRDGVFFDRSCHSPHCAFFRAEQPPGAPSFSLEKGSALRFDAVSPQIGATDRILSGCPSLSAPSSSRYRSSAVPFPLRLPLLIPLFVPPDDASDKEFFLIAIQRACLRSRSYFSWCLKLIRLVISLFSRKYSPMRATFPFPGCSEGEPPPEKSSLKRWTPFYEGEQGPYQSYMPLCHSQPLLRAPFHRKRDNFYTSRTKWFFSTLSVTDRRALRCCPPAD